MPNPDQKRGRPRVLTPGAYIKHRRTARGLSADDVALQVSTQPRLDARGRTEWLLLIEADAVPATFDTIVALRAVIGFDLAVLERLVLIAQNVALPPPPLCRVCACSDSDACQPPLTVCWWAAEDLCTNCAPLVPVAAALAAAA